MWFAVSLLLLILGAGSPLRSQPHANSNEGVIVSPGWLHANQQRVMVVEASWAKPEEAKDYLAGHIPGAVHANTDQFENGYPRWHLLAPKELQAAIGRLGIAPGARVVVYGRKPVVAARVWWILHYAGVADVRFLNGGYEAWTGAGYPGETAAQVRPGRSSRGK